MKAKITCSLFLILIFLACANDDDIFPANSFTKNVYIMHHFDGIDKLAKIDLSTGNLDYISSEINYRDSDYQNYYGMVYDPITKTFIGYGQLTIEYYTPDTSFYTDYVIKINQDGTTNIVYNEKGEYGFDSFSKLTIDDMGNYYILGQKEVFNKRLMKINTATAELDLVTEITNAQGYSQNLIYNPIDKTFAGLTFYGNWNRGFIMKIYPDGTTNTNNPVYINSTSAQAGGDLSSLVIDDLGNYYAFHHNENVKKLAKINLTTGNLDYVTQKIEFNKNLFGLVYSSDDKAFVGFDYDSEGKPFVILINLDGTTKTIYIKDEFLLDSNRGSFFHDLVIN